jgi:hypothetical protein
MLWCSSLSGANQYQRWTLCNFHSGGFLMRSPRLNLDLLHTSRLTWLANWDSIRNGWISCRYTHFPRKHTKPAEAYGRDWYKLTELLIPEQIWPEWLWDSVGGTIVGLRVAISDSVPQTIKRFLWPAQLMHRLPQSTYAFTTKIYLLNTIVGTCLGRTSIIQHLGGIHSGCATSGFVQLIIRVMFIFINHLPYLSKMSLWMFLRPLTLPHRVIVLIPFT